MAIAAGALAVASIATTAAATAHQVGVARQNVKREKKLAEARADDRRAELRRTLSAQRVALLEQGRNPDQGSSLVLRQQALEAAGREDWMDQFQTRGRVQGYQAESVSSVLRGLSSSSSTLLSYSSARQDTKLGKTGGG